MKIQLLTAAAILAVFTATTASANKLTINTHNNSTDAVAYGDVVGAVVIGGLGGAIIAAGARAEAGSVLVDASGKNCKCNVKVNVHNKSNGARAIGNASAGSTKIRL